MPKLRMKKTNRISFCSVCNITTYDWKKHWMGGGPEFEKHRKAVIEHSRSGFFSCEVIRNKESETI